MTDDGFAHFDFYNVAGPIVLDPEVDLAARVGAPILTEFLRRRIGWTQGMPVRGADGQLWFYPIIDLARIATAPGLAEEVHEVGLMHLLWRQTPDGDDLKATAKAVHDLRALRVSGRLLGLNYAWDDRMPDLIPPDAFAPAAFYGRSFDFDPTGWDLPGRFPLALLAHQDEWLRLAVLGQVERATRQVADLTETEAFRAFNRGGPSLN